MNRLLSQQPLINPHPSQQKQPSAPSTRQQLSIRTKSPSTAKGDSGIPKMSPTDYKPAKPVPLAQAGFHSSSQRTHSPHIIDQAVSRKPITASKNGSADSTHSTPTATTNASVSDFNRYQFEHSPTHTPTRTSYAGDLEMDPSVRLEEYDWVDLETQFAKRMEAFKTVEEGIWEEWRGWGEIFGAWASTISVHDEERASKRLRTRIAFTQNSEEGLEAKRMHYIKVVQAFEGALALLGDG